MRVPVMGWHVRLAVAAVVLSVTQAAACANAQFSYNNEFCRIQDYLSADQALSQAYSQLWLVLNPQQKVRLQHQEINWMRDRDHRCTLQVKGAIYVDYDCVTQAIEARTAALAPWLLAPAPPVTYGGLYSVRGTATPWLWQPGGLNDTFPNGAQDGTGPTVLTLAGLRARPGQSLVITYVSGHVSIEPGINGTDANGTTAMSQYDYGGAGSTRQNFPSAYMAPYPINLGALVGVFTDIKGHIIGQPFAIGDGPTQAKIPTGSIQLQLGINDDRLSDNSGQYAVTIKIATVQ